jgi:hypothetical protein
LLNRIDVVVVKREADNTAAIEVTAPDGPGSDAYNLI